MTSAPAGVPLSLSNHPYGVAYTGVPGSWRQLSANDPATTVPYPIESKNSVTAVFAFGLSP